MELELTTWERLKLTHVLGELRGNLAMLRKANKAMDALELDEAEQAEVGFQQVVQANGQAGYQWRDTDRVFTVEIADREAAGLLRRAFQQYEGWAVSELPQAEVLAGKLEIEQ